MEVFPSAEQFLESFDTNFDTLDSVLMLRRILGDRLNKELYRIVFSKVTHILQHLTDEALLFAYLNIILLILKRCYKFIKSNPLAITEESIIFTTADIKLIIDSCFQIGIIDNLQNFVNNIILTAIKIYNYCDRRLDDVFEPVPYQILSQLDQENYPLDIVILKIAKQLLRSTYIDDSNQEGCEFSAKLSQYLIELFHFIRTEYMSSVHINIAIQIIDNYYCQTEFLQQLIKDQLSEIVLSICHYMRMDITRQQPNYEKMQITAFRFFKNVHEVIEPFCSLCIMELISDKVIDLNLIDETIHTLVISLTESLIDDQTNIVWRANMNVAGFNIVTSINFMRFFLQYHNTLNESIISNVNFLSSILKTLQNWIKRRVEIVGTEEENEEEYSEEFVVAFICTFVEEASNEIDIIDGTPNYDELAEISRVLTFLITKFDNEDLNQAHAWFCENIEGLIEE